MRYIEVLTSVRVEREVEAYEATLELSTTAGRKVACFDQALTLRNTVLAALKDCGLTDAEIREGGGEAIQNSWSSTKSVVHLIVIRNASLSVLMSAMAATERHFSTLRHPFFGRIKQNFTFHPPTPIYAAIRSADDALREAIRSAHRTATVIANESGNGVGEMMTVVEHFVGRRASETSSLGYDDGADTIVDYYLSEADSIGAISYNGLPNATADSAQHFRVRFAVDDAEQSVPPENAS